MTGELTTSSDRLSNGRYFHAYDLRTTGPQRLRISLNSSAFDPELVLYECTQSCREIARNDDGGDGMDALLVASLPAAGDYSVVVLSHTPNSVGAYRLTVEDGSTGEIPRTRWTPSEIEKMRPTRAVVGDAMAGVLGEGDSVDVDGTYYDLWSFDAVVSSGYVVVVRSRDFVGNVSGAWFADTGLALFPGGGASTHQQSLMLDTPSPAWLTLRVKATRPGDRGAYTIRVIQRGTKIAIGQTVTGELAPGDRQLTDNSYFDEWAFEAAAGDRIRIGVTARSFRPFFWLGQYDEEQNDGYVNQVSAAGGSIEGPITSSGWYVVRVTSAGEGAKPGTYTLRIDRRN